MGRPQPHTTQGESVAKPESLLLNIQSLALCEPDVREGHRNQSNAFDTFIRELITAILASAMFC